MFVGQPFHDVINSTQYNVSCLFSENKSYNISIDDFCLFVEILNQQI